MVHTACVERYASRQVLAHCECVLERGRGLSYSLLQLTCRGRHIRLETCDATGCLRNETSYTLIEVC